MSRYRPTFLVSQHFSRLRSDSRTTLHTVYRNTAYNVPVQKLPPLPTFYVAFEGGRGRTAAKVDACLRGGEMRRPGYAPRQQHHRPERLGSGQLAGKTAYTCAPPRNAYLSPPQKRSYTTRSTRDRSIPRSLHAGYILVRKSTWQ